MPYNNNPIPPPKEVTGTVSLPLARVKKIISADEDIHQCSNNAAFAITIATEMFLQHLVEQSFNIVKAEKKPRRNVQYRDIANAVARVENLEFLTDVVPRTTTYKQFKNKSTRDGASTAAGANGAAPGQGTLDRHMGTVPAVDAARLDEQMETALPVSPTVEVGSVNTSFQEDTTMNDT